ncbi:PD-(D/E)XK nuclease family protein [Parabacteroides hominis]|uniref:PD-(D/E)XK nuclease family protein n=1 Tax=Parabacteroides hominis TaxID=2763057 RepID=A0ABR7DSM4_9BACT|nr:PD-(D/E)XK nuclease family protein [Parabacteroides hominis]MBC5634357.1 PD-(D/E)XK nuclease family protein [Parabacteroides hominis]
MKPFLYQVASLFYSKYGAEVSRLAFVFPNRRTGLFFQKYLSEVSEKPLFSPTILTINDLFVQLSGKQTADRISMLFKLYDIYLSHSGSSETFDEFLYWGEMLLNDFDDIDKYMADARMLFTNVTDLREIENDFSFLSPEQIAAIRTFWSSFYPKGDTPNQEQFLAVWQILYALYTDLREALAAEGKGYEGMIFREVVEQMERNECCDLPYTKVVFVGLNALSVAEERFLSELQKREIADFYWDYASPKVTDPDNKASYFVERNLRRFPSQLIVESGELKVENENGNSDAKQLSTFNSQLSTPKIEVIGIPSGIGQAKQVCSILNELCKEDEMSAEEALRTAVILPDEHLLIPVLNAIPEQIRRINVTMGYPLAGTPVASLMEYILALQKNIRYVDRRPVFYFRDVLPILNHRYISTTSPEVVSNLVKDISENNKIHISYDDLNQTPLLSILFTPVTEVEMFSDYLINVLQELNRVMTLQTGEEEEDAPQRTNDLEQEFIFHYFTTVNRMKEVMQEANIRMKIDTYFRLLKRVTDTITIPFHGEPLSGLQIMGVLETRALDFDRLIILSMNEGIFPLRKAANSFIPYNLRRGFGLPTYEHQDSVWAYHFYRLIYRASHVSLLYDTRSNGLQTGEVSRFVHQLHYHYEEPIQNKLVVYNVSSSKTPALQVAKTEEVMNRLAAFRSGGTRAISASAVNTYLDCPLKFYFSVVEGIREEEEVSETIESNVFGSILHKVMEELYQPFCGKMVTADLLKAIRKDTPMLTGAVARAFAEIFFKTDIVRPLTGQNFLIGEMIRKYVEKVLERDGKLTPFRYIESEKKIKRLFPLTDKSEIQLKGFIDRVDEVRDAVRIIDYKSGSGTTQFTSVEALFDKEDTDRAKAVMQVFMYAWMYGSVQLPTVIQPGIYYMRTLFSPSFDPGIYRRTDRFKTEQVLDFANYHADFENGLRNCLDEIFGRETPFVQTPNGKACVYCPFKDICGK